jgi:type II secretory pathway component PulJ
MDRRPSTHRVGGFSLLEAALSMTVMTLVLGATTALMHGTQRAWEAGSRQSQLQERGRDLLDTVMTDLRRTGLTRVGAAPFPSIWERPAGPEGTPRGNLIATLDYQDADRVNEVLAYNGDGQSRIERNRDRVSNEILFQLPKDTNGNGMPIDDEGYITFGTEVITYRVIVDNQIPTLYRITFDAGAEIARVPICQWVTGITFDAVFNDQTVRFGEIAVVVYMQRPGPDGSVVRAALESAVVLRNTREL